MRECYSQLYQINEEMLRNHKLNANNHEELLTILRKLNLIIQQASKLRGMIFKNTNRYCLTCVKKMWKCIRFFLQIMK